LFAHNDAWQWTPDLIWVDNLTVLPTPSYYVQQLFSCNRGDQVLPTTIKDPATGIFASSTWDKESGEVIIKVVNSADAASEAEVLLAGASLREPKVKGVVLTGPSLDAVNSFAEQKKVAPVQSELTLAGNRLSHAFPPHSLTVIRVPLK